MTIHFAYPAGLLLTSALSLGPPTSKPEAVPERPAEIFLAPREWVPTGGGYVYRVGFFSAAQMTDAGWRDVQLRSALSDFNMCPAGQRVLRQDVRWFAVKATGERCAILVYTIQCLGRALENPRAAQMVRLDLLRRDDEPPTDRDCGDKDAARQRARRSATPRSEHPSEPVSRIAPAATCRPGQAEYGPIRPTARSRIRFDSVVSPDAAEETRLAAAIPSFTRNPPARLEGQALRAFHDQRRPRPILAAVARPESEDDIRVTEELTLWGGRTGYCVRLTATQSGRRWSQFIQRRGFPTQVAGERSTTFDGLPRDPRSFWSPDTDSTLLARRLSAHLASKSSIDADPLGPFQVEGREINRDFPRGRARPRSAASRP